MQLLYWLDNAATYCVSHCLPLYFSVVSVLSLNVMLAYDLEKELPSTIVILFVYTISSLYGPCTVSADDTCDVYMLKGKLITG
jgi:hypothetical protein